MIAEIYTMLLHSAECPAGSCSDGVKVSLCPKVQYQDEVGQSTCRQCPNSKTTAGIGSIHITECIGKFKSIYQFI